MKRYRYVLAPEGDLTDVNRLLAIGWQPVRESFSDGVETGAPTAMILLEREDPFPVVTGETLAGDIPLSFFDDVRLFDGLVGEERRELLAACELRTFSDGEAIFEAGDADRAIHIVVQGKVALRFAELPVEETEVVELTAKDAFGESTFFASAAHSLTAEAIGATGTMMLTRERYDELLQARRTSAYKLALNAASLLGARLQQTDRWVRELLQEEQSTRIAQSWHRFRRRVERSSDYSGGFFHA
ncbi:Crp/Fnr family transcriptional regulator [Maioricimonas sp. JC845]|uniref:Crp/Fnr family transcriptional regulator n=1 Tax=Maioricimonas sp. JC845 TaxID=3232138 RepID=UPI00345795D6